MVNQEQPPATQGVKLLRQLADARLVGYPGTFVLHLPDQPVGCFNPPHAQALGWITTVAVAHGVDQGLLQPQLQLGLGVEAGDGFQQQLQQGSQLQGGRGNEI